MTHPLSPLRALRAALFAVVCVVLAAVGHSSLSAHVLDPSALLTAFAVTAAGAWCAAGRRRGPVACAAGTLAAQAVLHLTFSLTGAHGTAPATATDHGAHGSYGTPGAHGTHGVHGGTAPEGLLDSSSAVALPSSFPSLSSFSSVLDGGGGMLAAHLLAALVCGLWLARGEAAFFALAEGASRPLRRLFAAPLGPVAVPGDPRRPVRRPRRGARRPHVVVLASVLSRRGPPRGPLTRATVLGPLV
ncbi:hypothetical protein ACF1E9_01930 [Streptomyces roseolus]|uniref:hypothetical protein n=1 Tax=Streptomyces roseolus TaxID=67358 RepID=UPI0036F9E53A